MQRHVAILCAARKSYYHNMAGVVVYDITRDARTFAGDMPVVAHPPCRGWSIKMRHEAKPTPGEMELGIWCCEQLRRCGGILEQPAGSLLFRAGGLPMPFAGSRDDIWSLCVHQSWWGLDVRKPTWLCFFGIDERQVHVPYRLHDNANDWAIFRSKSNSKRSETIPAFAEWLVALARASCIN
jgi:hypothetical protein